MNKLNLNQFQKFNLNASFSTIDDYYNKELPLENIVLKKKKKESKKCLLKSSHYPLSF